MRIGIPGEILNNENRVAATPDTASKLQKLGFDVVVEKGAGVNASFEDYDYVQAGAEIVDGTNVWNSDIILKVNAPVDDEISLLNDGTTLASFIWPAQNEELMDKLSKRNINVLAMDSVPRLSRSQSLDALSSMANIGGYRAVVEASHEFGRFFTGQITAAGKIPPAKILVIGAGVAGLAALGAAGSMGAIVRAFDTRPEVKEQVESMGAEFLELSYEEEQDSSDGYAKQMSQAFIDAEMALFMEQAKEVDVIITTALIPGKPAPKLITEDMVKAMRPGSVIVDLAAQNGGNCECTVQNKVNVAHGVKVIGYTDLPSRLPTQSSQLYGTNLVNLLKLLCPNKDGQINIDFDDEVIRGLTVIRDGSITWPPPPVKVSAAPAAKTEPVAEATTKEADSKNKTKLWAKPVLMLLGILLFGFISHIAPSSFLEHFTVFMLASIVGYYVIWNVKSALHTPLMSVTNAISGIVVIGGLVQLDSDNNIALTLSAIAITVAVINIVGGFAVTQRMLKMFRLD